VAGKLVGSCFLPTSFPAFPARNGVAEPDLHGRGWVANEHSAWAMRYERPRCAVVRNRRREGRALSPCLLPSPRPPPAKLSPPSQRGMKWSPCRLSTPPLHCPSLLGSRSYPPPASPARCRALRRGVDNSPFCFLKKENAKKRNKISGSCDRIWQHCTQNWEQCCQF
jgi:hypothetical protein